MGENRDVVREDLESESLTDSDGGGGSEDEDSEYEDLSPFVVEPRDAAAMGTTEGPGASSSAPEASKRATDKDTMREEEAKWALVEQRSKVPQGANLQVPDTEWREGGSEERVQRRRARPIRPAVRRRPYEAP
jgi:hypothetical protein